MISKLLAHCFFLVFTLMSLTIRNLKRKQKRYIIREQGKWSKNIMYSYLRHKKRNFCRQFRRWVDDIKIFAAALGPEQLKTGVQGGSWRRPMFIIKKHKNDKTLSNSKIN